MQKIKLQWLYKLKFTKAGEYFCSTVALEIKITVALENQTTVALGIKLPCLLYYEQQHLARR